MRLAELLKVFALDMPVVALNAGAVSLNRLSDRIQSPAHGWPDIPWAGVIAVSDREDDATDSWASAFQILSEPDTNPAAVVFVDGPETLPRRHLAEMSRDQGWILELALNLDYAKRQRRRDCPAWLNPFEDSFDQTGQGVTPVRHPHVFQLLSALGPEHRIGGSVGSGRKLLGCARRDVAGVQAGL